MKRHGDEAGAILQQVFGEGAVHGCCRAASARQYLVIPGQHGPRWIVPSRSRLGIPVLTQWQPYNLDSLLKWKGLLFLYGKGVLGKVPGIGAVTIDSRYDLKIPGSDAGVTPVVYVGTPGPQRKAVVTLVDPENGDPRAVMKVALEEGAGESLLREAAALEKLATANVPGVPALFAVEDGGRRTWQSVVSGGLTARKLTRAHIEWLLRLPRSKEAITFERQQEILRSALQEERMLSKETGKTVAPALKKLCGSDPIPLVFTHGDFAPWNLKWQANGEIAAIDWEDAEASGLPLFDICHFYLLQAYLFGGRNPVPQVAGSSLVGRYLDEMGIERKHLVALVALYILTMLGNGGGNCSAAYRAYLVNQIPAVLAV